MKAIALVSMIICVLLVHHEACAGSTVYICSEADCSFTFTLGNCDIPLPTIKNSAASTYCGGSKTLSCSNTIQFSNVPAGTHYFSLKGCGVFKEGSKTVDGTHPYGITFCPAGKLACCPDGCGSSGSYMCSECSQPPTATTGNATSVTSSTATLNGSVNPNGSDTIYYFQYGTTISYGYATNAGSAGSGTSPISVSSNVTDLNPETTYHCRIVAINDAGTTYGQDKVFTTGSILPATIFGTVTDSMTSQPIDGAAVTTDGGGETMTSADGTYIFLHPAGKWTVTARADGYEEKSSGVIQLMEGAQVTIDLQLDPLSPTDTVYVNQYDASCNGHSPCYTSVQKAIDASFPGAVILVTTGRYNEDLTVDKSVIVTLQGGWDDTYSTRSLNTEVRSLTIGPEGGSLTADGINLMQ